MKGFISVIIAVLCSLPFVSIMSFADEVNSDGVERLMFMEIPSVVTASKHAESIDNAPNAMYVVTEEQIKERGYNRWRTC